MDNKIHNASNLSKRIQVGVKCRNGKKAEETTNFLLMQYLLIKIHLQCTGCPRMSDSVYYSCELNNIWPKVSTIMV